MEARAISSSSSADLHVFDLEVGSEDPQDASAFVQLLRADRWRINLEDIRSRMFFCSKRVAQNEKIRSSRYQQRHGDYFRAALRQRPRSRRKENRRCEVVFSGAGAAAISTAEHYVPLGVNRENILMCDKEGVIYEGRTGHSIHTRSLPPARPTRARSPTRSLAPMYS